VGSTIKVEVDEQEQEQVDDLPQPTTPPGARRRKLSEVVSPSPIWTNMYTSPLQIRPARRHLPTDSPLQRYPTRARKRSKKEEARQNEVIQISDDDEDDDEEDNSGRDSDDDFKG
jgi:transglutaminase-like putative cysteine protease